MTLVDFEFTTQFTYCEFLPHRNIMQLRLEELYVLAHQQK